jgi:hypothetical protein
MPNVAKMVDEIRKHFGNDVKVLYAKEGDYELGTPIDRRTLAKPNVCPGIPPKNSKR